MLDKDGLGRLLEYTEWANHRVLEAVAALSQEQFARDLGSSHGGVRGTLAHTLGAEWIWLERFKGVSPTSFPAETELAELAALRARWAAVEADRGAWFRALPAASPAATIRYRNLKGDPFEGALWQLVQHVANHSTYHRGQVIAFLRQLGAKAVGTDLVTWDRERA